MRVQVGDSFASIVIGRLTGTIVDQGVDGACVIDVNGVGYEVFVPLGALGKLASSAPAAATTTTTATATTTTMHGASRVVLHVHTVVREDAFTLYGFPSLNDRAAFRVLIGVTGIGPKLALGILSSMSAADLADAIGRGDKARFKGVSGVGTKLVSRLVLELKDKLDFARGAPSPGVVSKPKPQQAFDGQLGTVHAALVQMGFRPVEAEQAILKIGAQADGKQTEQLLREALSVLA
jgi:Holliday junction DNA helicase RuvA